MPIFWTALSCSAWSLFALSPLSGDSSLLDVPGSGSACLAAYGVGGIAVHKPGRDCLAKSL